jgi:hypothetical protein
VNQIAVDARAGVEHVVAVDVTRTPVAKDGVGFNLEAAPVANQALRTLGLCAQGTAALSITGHVGLVELVSGSCELLLGECFEVCGAIGRHGVFKHPEHDILCGGSQ